MKGAFCCLGCKRQQGRSIVFIAAIGQEKGSSTYRHDGTHILEAIPSQSSLHTCHLSPVSEQMFQRFQGLALYFASIIS